MQKYLVVLNLALFLGLPLASNESWAKTGSKSKAVRIKSCVVNKAKQSEDDSVTKQSHPEIGRIEGPRDMNLFLVEPTVLDERRYSDGGNLVKPCFYDWAHRPQ